jgi:hypothetical protein
MIAMVFTILSPDLMAQAPGQNPPPANASGNVQTDIAFRSWVERTALFPGDTTTYHVEILCNDNVDILLEDLDADELGLAGLELLSSKVEQEQTGEGTKYHATYELITFEATMPKLIIEDMRVRYYFKRPGQRMEDVATVGEVVVPAISLVLRSTLPTELSELELRDMSSAITHSSWVEFAGTLGLLLIIVSAVPLGLLITNRLRQHVSDTHHQFDKVPEETFTVLEQIKNFDAEDPGQRRQGFDQLQKILKEFIEKYCKITASALTASEIQLHLSESVLSAAAKDISSVLEDCERARYGRHDNLPAAKGLEDGIELAQSLLNRQ